MSLADGPENAILLLIFNATAWANVAQNNATSPYTQWHLGGHTADPTDSGNQTSSECAYTSYARVATNRDGTDWPVTTSTANLGATESFPQATGGTETMTHFSVGGSSTGTGYLLCSGTVSPNVSISSGVTPQLTTSTAISLA